MRRGTAWEPAIAPALLFRLSFASNSRFTATTAAAAKKYLHLHSSVCACVRVCVNMSVNVFISTTAHFFLCKKKKFNSLCFSFLFLFLCSYSLMFFQPTFLFLFTERSGSSTLWLPFILFITTRITFYTLVASDKLNGSNPNLDEAKNI